MAILTKEQRNQLSKIVLAARAAAEPAAKKALHSLGVDEADAPSYLSVEKKTLRRALRAQARQLGDKEDPRKKGSYDLYHLTGKIAYDQWHRMIFARFLTENDLLIAPHHGVPVSLDECRGLAPELGLRDEWDVAVRFATAILPQIFRADDPAGKIELAPEDRTALRDLVISLSRDVFLADDSLGWVYQFWQAKRKDEVNKLEKKIGADEIAPVTQLFTEHYMVEFLLHNTLGAWWVAKRKEEGKDPLLSGIEFTYLRYKDDGTPAAGTYSDWPREAKQLRLLDPCMGSGHFLVTELPILIAMRVEEEGLSKSEACDAVLRDNLFGLEIDARCTQIAAFNLALTAWKIAGYRPLPPLKLACSGLGINDRKEQWLRLANGEDKLSRGMGQLYDLFRQAPLLGSLIDPRRVGGDLLIAEFHQLQPLLERALSREKAKADENFTEMGVIARGIAKAGEILASQFNLIATNIPYLGRGKQDETLQKFCASQHVDAKANLATCFVERCLAFCDQNGSIAIVAPQNWLFLSSYKSLRKHLLRNARWDFIARLGPKGFQTPMWDLNVMLLGLTQNPPTDSHQIIGLDVAQYGSPATKQDALRTLPKLQINQKEQLSNPDARVVLTESAHAELLERHAAALAGINTGDYARFGRVFTEILRPSQEWEFQQSTTSKTQLFAGATQIVKWCGGGGEYSAYVESLNGRLGGSWKRGREVWGKRGVAVSQMSSLPAALYLGMAFDSNISAVVPHDQSLVPALWCYLSSEQFREDIRAIDQKVNVTNATIGKVPFDAPKWRNVALEKFPEGLPQPRSKNPTLWLFDGHPCNSDYPLQVSIIRLLGYLWPRQTGSSFPYCPALEADTLDKLADEDGLVCINPIKGEQPAAERLRALLAAAFGAEWTPGKQNELLEQAGFGGKALEDWMRNGFFEQHCAVFHQRPFIWHVWDGRRDGFSALVNYHKLNRSNLEKLTYTFLGDWIARQKGANDAGEEGSDARLQAAQELKTKLEKIIEGEAPFDIFVRWKPIEKQPIGWEPDLNDGVRLNIRPFIEAGVLRKDPKINWNKDRGKDVGSAPWYNKYDLKRVPDYKPGDRINDYHLKLEEKRRARSKI